MEKPAGISPRDGFGYTLIAIGLLLICYALFNAYSLFSGNTKPQALFSLPGISLDITQSLTSQLTEFQRAALPSSNPQEVVPSQSVNDPLNLFAHIFFLGFFVTVGAKLAGVGVDMTRPYVIKQPSKPPVV